LIDLNIDKLENIVCKELKGKSSAHDFSHAKRVLGIAREIADESGEVNILLLSAMCLLHDVVRIEGDGEEDSASLSAERSKALLMDCGFDEEDIETVIRGIKSHSLISRGGDISDMLREPQTIEEKILFDADKLDSLGPIGIARWFISVSKKQWDLEKSARTYLRIMDNFIKLKGGLYTEHGTRLAQKKIEYSRKYMENLLEHLDKG
jgi:uncharacterized protein